MAAPSVMLCAYRKQASQVSGNSISSVDKLMLNNLTHLFSCCLHLFCLFSSKLWFFSSKDSLSVSPSSLRYVVHKLSFSLILSKTCERYKMLITTAWLKAHFKSKYLFGGSKKKKQVISTKNKENRKVKKLAFLLYLNYISTKKVIVFG